MGAQHTSPCVFLLLLLTLSSSDGWHFSKQNPSSTDNTGGTNFKLRLPNELEMGLSESPQKIDENEDNLNEDDSKRYQHRNIHMDMNTHELQFHFGVKEPHQVDKSSYQIIKILPVAMPRILMAKRDQFGTTKDKRDGSEADENPHFEMNAFDRKIKLPVRTNNKFLKGDYKVVYVDKAGNRKQMKTKRMAQSLSKVGQSTGAMKLARIGSHAQPLNNKMGSSISNLVKVGKNKRNNGGRMSVAEDGFLVDPTDEYVPMFEEICSHYEHTSTRYIGAISECEDEGTTHNGFVSDFDNGESYEVHPLNNHFSNVIDNWDCGPYCRHHNGTTRSKGRYHVVVRRSLADAQRIFDEETHGKKRSVVHDILKRSSIKEMKPKEKRSGRPANKIVEIGIFIDDKAFDIYYDYFNARSSKDAKKQLILLVLAVMNGVQAVYHYPSLWEPIDFRIVYLEVQERRKIYHTGEQGEAYKAFCTYQKGVMEDLGALEDSHPNHWDTSLLVSGWNFYGRTADGRKSYATMGLAAVGGICIQQTRPPYNCVIGEMGVKDHQDKPYPSCGFTTVFVMAHEIGHNLGMSHDGKRNGKGSNRCPKQGNIMSPSRGTTGETLWSSCSAEVLGNLDLPCIEEGANTEPNAKGLNHNMFGNLPGLVYTPREQCQLYTQDKNARLYIRRDSASATNINKPNDQICIGLQCKVSDNNSGYYTAGPALEGTVCGKDHYCIKSECTYMTQGRIKQIMSDAQENQNNIATLPPEPAEVVGLDQATWSSWSSWTACESACILGSTGSRKRHRTCNTPRSLTELGKTRCRGDFYSSQLCDYQCRAVRPARSFAEVQCQNYRNAKTRLDRELNGRGKQPSHNPSHPEQACMVYCQTHDKTYYSPHVELSGMKDVQIHFPDGTRCHIDERRDVNYYCKKGVCMPEGSRIARVEIGTPDVPYEQSADPHEADEDGAGESVPPESVVKYFTLDENEERLTEVLDGATQEQKEFEMDDELEAEVP